jgi:alpha-glucosidase
MGAKYKMMIDFHGAYKPTGLHRTYPNVINFEGVHGLEQVKWLKDGAQQVVYDVTIPFIRMLAGPMDYTQGAMRNATRRNYHPVNSEPMSPGTRCRQLAEYVIFDAPFTMLCDSPSNYLQEPECTKYIAEIPTVWDETLVLNGKIGEFVTMARRSGDTWYVGSMTDWTPRDMTVELGFLPAGNYSVEIFKDGANAHRAARDYAKEELSVRPGDKLKLHMAPGGGWVAKIVKK